MTRSTRTPSPQEKSRTPGKSRELQKSRGLQPARPFKTGKRTVQRALIAIAILATATVWTNAQPQEEPTKTDRSSVRFIALDIYIDSGETPLAAYQFELTAEAGQFKIVGLEGGEHTAFAKPPYYDKKALSDSKTNHDRVIVAAFDTGDDLPTGNTRVARVHVQITGEPTPDFAVKLTVAASEDGETLDAIATCSQGK
jgi:hypothetical protein